MSHTHPNIKLLHLETQYPTPEAWERLKIFDHDFLGGELIERKFCFCEKMSLTDPIIKLLHLESPNPRPEASNVFFSSWGRRTHRGTAGSVPQNIIDFLHPHPDFEHEKQTSVTDIHSHTHGNKFFFYQKFFSWRGPKWPFALIGKKLIWLEKN